MDGLVIGLDLDDDYTQICRYDREKPQTVPTVIYRRKGEEVWLSGEEVYAATLLGEGVIVDKLPKMAVEDGISTTGGICYDGGTLLKLFIEKILGYPGKEFSTGEMAQLVTTLQNVDCRLLDTLMYCADYLEIPRDRVYAISHTRGFVYYILNQKKELWTNQVGPFELSGQHLCYYEMRARGGIRRNMAQAEAQNQERAFNLGVLGSPSGNRLADRILTACGEKLLNRKPLPAVSLTGRGFKRWDWAGGFTRLIRNRRKVFMESCFFAREAAYKGADCTHQEIPYPYIFICEGRFKAEVPLKVMCRGRENRPMVVPHGDSWYGSKSPMNLVVDGQKGMEFTTSLLDSKEKKLVRIPLTGFPERPLKTTRVELKAAFTDEGTMTMSTRDKGFRGLFPFSGAVVEQEVKL